jgi:7-carboxy-7-deazaguanine synthase
VTLALRLSEVYLSIQGEGPRVGHRTVFVRTGGCNLRCPGWPCDTPHAIFPDKFRSEWVSTSPQDVVDKVRTVDNESWPANVCFTGGEPFLQNSQAFYDTIVLLREAGYTTFEVFTNGTLRFPDWALEELHFIFDWKLPGSGETFDRNELQRMRCDNLERAAAIEGNVVKFTIADWDDYDCAVETYRNLIEGQTALEVYYGAVWGKQKASALIEWVLEDKLPWVYNHQIHNVIWDREKRGI